MHFLTKTRNPATKIVEELFALQRSPDSSALSRKKKKVLKKELLLLSASSFYAEQNPSHGKAITDTQSDSLTSTPTYHW